MDTVRKVKSIEVYEFYNVLWMVWGSRGVQESNEGIGRVRSLT